MMVKDPEDNGRTAEIPFPLSPLPEYYAENMGTPFEKLDMVETPVEPVQEAEPEFKSTLSPEAKATVEKALRARTFSERNLPLGKMINCQVCGQRHRQSAEIHYSRTDDGQKVKTTVIRKPCEQKFTHVVNGYEEFREDPKTGTLVPYLRTAVDPELTPTVRQQVGAAVFAKRRHNRHLKGWQLELVERTRKTFAEMGFTITEGEQAQKNMAIARKAALRQMLNERREKRIAKRNQTKLSRRINWGLANNGSLLRGASQSHRGAHARRNNEDAAVVAGPSGVAGQAVAVRDGSSGSSESGTQN